MYNLCGNLYYKSTYFGRRVCFCTERVTISYFENYMFAYLKHYGRSKLVFGTAVSDVSEGQYMKCDWSEFYPDAKEVIPSDAPEPLGVPVVMSGFVDADLAGCKATRRSHTGVINFLNNAPILWFSKRQTTVESSTF